MEGDDFGGVESTALGWWCNTCYWCGRVAPSMEHGEGEMKQKM